MRQRRHRSRKKWSYLVTIVVSHLGYVIEKLNQQRSILNELEENLNEKKRKFKYEIMLSDELNNLKKIEQNVDNP